MSHGMQGTGDGDVVEVMPGDRRQRAVLAPAGHASVDQFRIALQANHRAHAQPLHHPGAEALDQHVGLVDQTQQHIHRPRFARVDANTAAATTDHAVVAIEEAGH
ncbi:hypothetical protein D3C81_1295250 [compost metagenome]